MPKVQIAQIEGRPFPSVQMPKVQIAQIKGIQVPPTRSKLLLSGVKALATGHLAIQLLKVQSTQIKGRRHLADSERNARMAGHRSKLLLSGMRALAEGKIRDLLQDEKGDMTRGRSTDKTPNGKNPTAVGGSHPDPAPKVRSAPTGRPLNLMAKGHSNPMTGEPWAATTSVMHLSR